MPLSVSPMLKIGSQPIDLFTAPEATILSATFATLEFTTQKNAVLGEVISHGKSGSSTFCPVKSLAWRVLHLRRYGVPPETPLASSFAGSPSENGNMQSNFSVISHSFVELIRHVILHYMQ
jgi:hypothetical protein